MSEQQIRPLTAAEQEWVAVRRDFAAQEGTGHLDLDVVDAYHGRLLARSRSEDVDPDELGVLLDVVAVLLGEHLGARHGLAWVAVTEGDATDLGLRDPLSDAVVFPQSVVAQHWNDGDAHWIPGYVDWLGAQLAPLREERRAAEG